LNVKVIVGDGFSYEVVEAMNVFAIDPQHPLSNDIFVLRFKTKMMYL